MNMITELKKLECGTVIENANLKEYTTYQINGTIDAVVLPTDLDQLKKLLSFLKKHKIKYKIIGNGSNLIFNSHYDGVLIKLDHWNQLEIKQNHVKVGAGYSIMKLALKASRMGLSGLEFATGIPGTVGGTVFMNAGAYKSDMGYIVTKVTILS